MTQRRRPPPIPSPLRQMRRAYSNSNSDPPPIPGRRASTASFESTVSSIASTSSAGSWSFAKSSRPTSRRQSLVDSVTAPLSRMSVSGNRSRSCKITAVDPRCKPSRPRLDVESPIYSSKGMVSVKIAPPGLQVIDTIHIPLEYCDYDRQDRLVEQCLREYNFANCRLSGILLSIDEIKGTASLQREPLLTLDAGAAWRRLSQMRAIDYREISVGEHTESEVIPYGQAKMRLLDDSRNDLWLDWSLLNVKWNDKLLIFVNAMPPRMRLQTVTTWIRSGRLFVENVHLNSFGRAISGDFSLRASRMDA